MKLIFLGSGGAFSLQNYHSNMLIRDGGEGLLIDCGGDVRRSLAEAGFSHQHVDAVYVSHLHSDHIGGLEWLAYARYFTGHARPRLIVPYRHMAALRRILTPGLENLGKKTVTIDEFFNVQTVLFQFQWQSRHFTLVENPHAGSHVSYGLCFGTEQRIYLSTDCNDAGFRRNRSLIERSDRVFHDCETLSAPSGVHTAYATLVELPPMLRDRVWLYHYSDGALPPAQQDGFAGFVQKGQAFDLS